MKDIKIIALTLSAILLFGCSSSETANTAVITGDYTMPIGIQISPLRGFTIPVEDTYLHKINYVPDTEEITKWEAYMSDRWNTTVTIKDNMEARAELIEGKYSGMIQGGISSIKQFIDRGLILPIDDYLADNKAWNNLPETFRKQFEYNGHIWAIPLDTITTTNTTSIRTDWLENVGAKMPTTLDELYEVGQKFISFDANRDNVSDNDNLMGGYEWSGIRKLVLQSFGLYTEYTSVAYDPTEGCVVDALFKPQAKEALQYLRDMLLKGMIDPQSVTNPLDASRIDSAGSYGTIENLNMKTAKYETGVNWTIENYMKVLGHPYSSYNVEDYAYATGLYEALPPLSDEFPLTYYTGQCGYVLSAATSDPKETVNAFVDMLYSNSKCFLDFYIGVPENYTMNSDNIVILNYKDKINKTFPTNPQIVSQYGIADNIGSPEIMLGDSFVVLNPDEKKAQLNEKIKKKVEKLQCERDYIKSYTKTNQMVEISNFYTNIFSPMSKEYNLVLESLTNETLTIDEILNHYKQQAKWYDIAATLQKANADLGPQSKQIIE